MKDDKPLVSFDYAIKYLLKNKGDYEIIEGFISAVLKSQGYEAVKIVSLLETESNKEDELGKSSLADLVVEDGHNHKYIVEIERNYKESFIHKACFNTSRLIIDHLGEGVDYTKIVKVFHISLLYFPVGNGAVHHGKTVITDIETHEPLSFHLENKATGQIYDAVDVMPEYFFISVPLFNDRLEKEIDEWLYVLKYDNIPENFSSPYMQKVANRLAILKMSPEERNGYFNYMKKIYDDRDALQAATNMGIFKGRIEGRAEGKIENQIETIMKMINFGMSLEEISNLLELSMAEIEGLLARNKICVTMRKN